MAELETLLREILAGRIEPISLAEGYPEPGTPRIISEPLNFISPILGSIAQLLRLDKSVLQILQPYSYAYRGAFGEPFDRSAILLNAYDRSAFGAYQMGLDRASDEAMRLMRAKVYERFGMSPEQAYAQAGRAFAPLNIAMELFGMGAYDIRGLRSSFISGAILRGLGATPMDWQLGVSSLSEAERRYYFGSPEAYLDYIKKGGTLDTLRAEETQRMIAIQTKFIENRSLFGNLKGSEIGQLYTEMSRAGAFAGQQDPNAIADSVARMARTLSSLKDVFKGPLKEVIKQLEDVFGSGMLATYSPEQIQALAGRLIHTARLSGISFNTLQEMASVSRQYARAIGGFEFAAGEAAMLSANIISSTIEDRRFRFVDQEMFNSAILKHVTGAQQSYRAKLIAGAYATWLTARNFKDTEENRAVFMNLIGNETTLKGLADIIGASQSEILQAGNSMLAREFLATSPAIPRAAMETNMRTIMDYRNTIIRRALATQLNIDVSKLDLSGAKTLDEVLTTIEQQTGASGVAVEGLVRGLTDSIVKTYAGYENAEAFDKAYLQLHKSKIKEAQVRERTILQTKLSDALGAGGGGFSAIMEAIAKGDTTVAGITAALFGFTTYEEYLNAVGNVTGKIAPRRMAELAKKMEGTTEGMITLANLDTIMGEALMKGQDMFGEDITTEDWVRYAKDPEQFFRERTRAGKLLTLKEELIAKSLLPSEGAITESDIRVAKYKDIISRLTSGKSPLLSSKDVTEAQLEEEIVKGLDILGKSGTEEGEQLRKQIEKELTDLNKLTSPAKASMESILDKIGKVLEELLAWLKTNGR